MKKTIFFILIIKSLFFFNNNSFAQVSGTSIFLQGSWVEIGIAKNGSWGQGWHLLLSRKTTGTKRSRR